MQQQAFGGSEGKQVAKLRQITLKMCCVVYNAGNESAETHSSVVLFN